MGYFLVRRLALVIPVLLAVSFVTFSLQRVEEGSTLRLSSYGEWLGRMSQGDLGRSALRHKIPVGEAISKRLPVTLELAGLTMILSLLIAIPGGILASMRRNSWVDNAATFLALLGNSIPNFLLAISILLFFAVYLRWLPPSGFVPFTVDPLANLRHMLMPTVALATGMAALTMRMTRASLLEVINKDYIRTARSKGLTEKTVILRHALKNAFLPVVTAASLQVGLFLEGAVIVETIFALPGLGQLLVNSLFLRDYPMAQGVILLIAISVVFVNLLADILYAYLDPRIRLR